MTELQKILESRQGLQPYLFCRGFLLTDERQKMGVYPFWNNWQELMLKNYYLYVHLWQKVTIYKQADLTCIMVGHAYNPFSLETDESVILTQIVTSEHRIEIINQLTGIFFLAIISEKGVEFHTDSSGMQSVCYGLIRHHLYISSHMRLIGDLLNLQMSDYVSRLVNYRWYPRMMGNYLPGDITCFGELTRVIPNTYITYSDHHFTVTRFYPSQEIRMCQNDDDYESVIHDASELLRNNMILIAKKWEHPAISLTGGIDSNTTFAAANGIYDKYSAFSYVSMPREAIDAEQAERISKRFNVPWKRYDIPDSNEDVQDFAIFKAILEWNDGGIGTYSDNDIRKKITLIRQEVCDVEVKSWISETVRAYAYKYFGRTVFPDDLSARNYTSLYKLFFFNRRLVHETDEAFRQYWSHTNLKEHLFNYDESDLFVWEMMYGGKCGLDIGVMKTCFDITIPYNNRLLLDLLLRVPLEKRLSDQLHLDMKKTLNRDLYDMNIRVVNANETEFRKKCLNAYFTINSHLPF